MLIEALASKPRTAWRSLLPVAPFTLARQAVDNGGAVRPITKST